MQTIQPSRSPWPSGWGGRTCVMAILNITHDSFSDGGKYFDLDKSIERAINCIQSGADIIDIGAQSTRPGAYEIGVDEELKRLIPLVKQLKKDFPNFLISIDTYHHLVAQKVLELGVDWINDISGGRHDPSIFNVVASYSCPYVLTHSRGNSMTMLSLDHYSNLIEEVINELNIQTSIALSRGIKQSNIVWDPGLGFAKNNSQNIQILKHIDKFIEYKFPLLIGPSRKRFIGSIINEEKAIDRVFGTAAVISKCVSSKVDIVRVHDVKEMVQVINMTESMC